MIYDNSVYPASPATDSSVLFNSLGYFWKRIFKDKAAVNGITIEQSESAIQAYTQLLDMIDSYSASDIPVFETRNWYPLVIKKSDLDYNFLMFGEDVLFGSEVNSTPYTFGRGIPEETNVYSIVIPSELYEISIIASQIISPGTVWVAGQDVLIKNDRLYFYGNPFSKAGVYPVDLYDNNGSAITYTHYDPDTGEASTVADQIIILWCYKAKLDSNNLKYNIGYLFGLNVPQNDYGKEILKTVVKTYTNGPTINDIKAVCLASLGLPIITEDGVVETVIDDGMHNVVVTNSRVYRYAKTYTLKSEVVNGYQLKKGYVAVKAVELFDNINDPVWSATRDGYTIISEDCEVIETLHNTNDHTKSIITNKGIYTYPESVTITAARGDTLLKGSTPFTSSSSLDALGWWQAEFGVDINGVKDVPLYLPPALMLGNYKHSLVFRNEVGPVSINNDGDVTAFPVIGNNKDVTRYLASISTPAFIAAVNSYIASRSSTDAPLTALNPVMINPVDFIFRSFMRSTAAMLRVKFLNIKQLSDFCEYFAAIKDNLPPHILLIVLCDIMADSEVIQLNSLLDDGVARVTFNRPMYRNDDIVGCNTGVGGLTINSMDYARTIPDSGIISSDLGNTISLTRIS
jgi:hypothetical protein